MVFHQDKGLEIEPTTVVKFRRLLMKCKVNLMLAMSGLAMMEDFRADLVQPPLLTCVSQ